ncbi:hypothetical protein Plec18170_009301 [Paecilomyces lecythidis]
MTSKAPDPTQLPLASILVARFLRSNNYTETLDAFIREAGLPSNAGQVNSKTEGADGWTIESVIEEKKAFDQTVNFERYGDEDAREKRDRWSSPAPSKPATIHTPSSSNLLSVSVQPWERQSSGEVDAAFKSTYIIATGADRRLNLFKTSADHEAAASFSGLTDSPILSHVTIRGGSYQLATSMSGQLLLLRDSEVLHRRKDHTKYVVQVTAHEQPDSNTVWVATAGWDGRILIYSLDLEHDAGNTAASLAIGEPRAKIQLPTNPESIIFVRHTETGELILLASRRDSTYIYYYEVSSEPSQAAGEESNRPYEPRLLGKQNLAPHSNAWVAFSPSYLALSPHDPGLLAVATSTLPHMKVMIVRLLFPSPDGSSTGNSSEATSAEPETQVTQAMAALALQNREDAAIIIQANTLAPQTAYSTPQVVWRPDGSGLWVNGDDGVIRGIEAKTGKIVALLKDGHEVGSKIRSIWAGWVDVDGKEDKEEWVVSGGFDKRLIVWKV